MHHTDGGDAGEERLLRGRLAALGAAVDGRAPPANPRTPVVLGTVYQKVTLPTTNGVFYAVRPTRVSGVTAENAVATFTADATRTEYFRVIGNHAPAAGDVLVGRHVDHRWQAERHAIAGGIPECIPFSTATAGWPSTMHITTFGQTVAMVKQTSGFFVGWWWGQADYPLTAWTKDLFTGFDCATVVSQPTSPLDFFIARDGRNCLLVLYGIQYFQCTTHGAGFYLAGYARPAGAVSWIAGDPPMATLSAFSSSPPHIAGTWNTLLLPAGCGPSPLDGLAFDITT